jgi:hypothetical protein
MSWNIGHIERKTKAFVSLIMSRNINNSINYKNKIDPVLICEKKYKFM